MDTPWPASWSWFGSQEMSPKRRRKFSSTPITEEMNGLAEAQLLAFTRISIVQTSRERAGSETVVGISK